MEWLVHVSGYLRGRALQEWRLLGRTLQQDYETAISALGSPLDLGRKSIAAEDFRHSSQKSGECVPDFIRKLEKTYQIANGKDDLSQDTRDALLYCQRYEGQCYDLMHSRKELFTAAKREERRVAALKRTPSPSRSSQEDRLPPRDRDSASSVANLDISP